MSQFGGIDPLAGNVAAPSVRDTQSRFGEMSTEDFLDIIFTELSNQDPFDPNDSSALLKQIESIRSIEADIRLEKQLKNIVTQNQLASAGGLVGKFVGGLTAEANRVSGFVVGVSRAGNQINLELDNGRVVPMDNVESILDPNMVPGEAP